MKKTKTKKLYPAKILKYAAIVFISLLTVINSIAIVAHWQYYSRHDNGRITELILKASESLNRPTVTEPSSGNVYLPTARLVLPPENTAVGRVLYNYIPGEGDYKAEIHIARAFDISQAESKLMIASNNGIQSLFDAVPKLQACSRGVMIAYEESEGGTAAGSKVLKDGNKVYFYTEDACYNEDLLKYVKQIESY